MATPIHASSSSPSYFQEVIAPYWPPSDDTLERTKKVAIGIFTAVAFYPISAWVDFKITDFMQKLNISTTEPQDVLQIWNEFSAIPFRWISLIFKTALLGFIVIVAPIIEEYFFRDKLHDVLRHVVRNHNPDSYLGKMLRILGNGLMFGLVHLSVEQGWTNIPMFCSTALMGFVLATLRETTGDTTASTAAHILHNGIVMFQFTTS